MCCLFNGLATTASTEYPFSPTFHKCLLCSKTLRNTPTTGFVFCSHLMVHISWRKRHDFFILRKFWLKSMFDQLGQSNYLLMIKYEISDDSQHYHSPNGQVPSQVTYKLTLLVNWAAPCWQFAYENLRLVVLLLNMMFLAHNYILLIDWK